MRYPILTHSSDKLKIPARSIGVITDEMIALLDSLYEATIANDEVGIAASQAEQNKRITVTEADKGEEFELINPEIIETKGESMGVGGCLSIPHVYGTTKRVDEVTVRYYSHDGGEIEVTAFGYLARALQHETDHLDGTLFIGRTVQQILKKGLEEYMKEHLDD